MLAKQDADHVVRATAFNLGKWANKTEAEVLEALKVLSSPDTKRLEPQPFEGRRIQRVEDGWFLLNGQKFEDEMREISRRIYKARKEREYREAKKRAKQTTGEASNVKLENDGASKETVDGHTTACLPEPK